MSSVKVFSLTTSEGLMFAADNERCASYVERTLREELRRVFSAHDSTVQGPQPATWVLYNGAVRFSSSRTVRVVSVTGSAHELHVVVEGTTADANDVLREVWHHMNAIAGQLEPPPLESFEQTGLSNTRAVVELPFSASELFPFFDVVLDALRAGSRTQVLDPPGNGSFRLAIPIRIAVGGLVVDREMAIEPRFTAKLSDRIYFTTSPLGSAEHLAMLEKVVLKVTQHTPVAGG